MRKSVIITILIILVIALAIGSYFLFFDEPEVLGDLAPETFPELEEAILEQEEINNQMGFHAPTDEEFFEGGENQELIS